MAIAAKKTKELLEQFIAILVEKRTFQDSEEFGFRRELRNFPEGEIEGDQLHAFYYACAGNSSKAIDYFKKSLSYNEPNFMSNYLIYLIKSGFIKQYISESIRVNGQLPHNPSLLSELFTAYTLLGDIDGFSNVIEKAKQLGVEATSYEKHKLSMDSFKEALMLSSEDVKFITDVMVDIADKNRIEVFDIDFDGADDLYSVELLTSCKNSALMAEMNKELADRIANEERFIGKVFAPMIRYYVPEIMRKLGYAD